MASIRVFQGNGGSNLRHPSAGPVKTHGSMWPSDSFTHRRIADGSVIIKDSGGTIVAESGVVGDVGRARRRRINQVVEGKTE